MAVFTGITNTSTFDPGFTFSDWMSSINSTFGDIATLASEIEQPDYIGLADYGDYQYYATWSASGTTMGFDGSYTLNSAGEVTGTVKITEADIETDSGVNFGFIGTGTINAETGAISTIKAKEIWVGSDESNYYIDYRGSLNFNVTEGIVSGSIKTLYLVAENGDGTGKYVKLSGNVTANSNGDFSSGSIKSIEWGTLVEGTNEPTFTQSGIVSGLNIAATQLETTLGQNGFDGLIALAYSGNDTVTGTASSDTLLSGAGNDKVFGMAGDDLIKGQAGNDALEGGAGADTMNGGEGKDKLYGYSATTLESADDGNDAMNGWSGNDTLYGGAGDDSMTGGADADTLYGGAGNDSIGGDLNPSNLADYGIDSSSAEYTRYGKDKIWAGAGNDKVNGGGGSDQIFGEDGDDLLYGDRSTESTDWMGSDKLDGGNGNDQLFGFGGKDTLIGGAGNDLLAGDGGVDTLTGGAGADYFVFRAALDVTGLDNIKDFVSGTDKVWLDLDIYTALEGATASNFTTAKAAASATEFLIYNGNKLYYDADGSGAGAAVAIAGVKGLQFSDLVFGDDVSEISLA